MKRIIIDVIVLLIIVLCVVGVIRFCRNDSIKSEKNDYYSEIGKFRIVEYRYFVEEYPSEIVLGEILSVEDAVKKAENVWFDIYGKEALEDRPYKVSYDDESNVWLVCGTLPPNTLGGTAHILIENDTGKVLAVWNYK